MTKRIVALVGLCLVMGGCATNKVSHDRGKSIEAPVTNVGSTNLEQVALDMTDNMLSARAIIEITKTVPAVVFIESVSNKTAEHINMQAIKNSITNRIGQTNRFQFVDEAKINEVRQALNFETHDGLVNQLQAIKFAKMIGAQYILSSSLALSSPANATQDGVFYKMTMRLVELKTGLSIWTDEKTFNQD